MTGTRAQRLAEAVDNLQKAASRRHDSKEVTVSADDLEFLLRRVEALETCILATREIVASLPEDALGYDTEGDPQVATRSWPVRDRELWQIDQVLANGLSAYGRVRTAEVPEAQFDVMVPAQEALVLEFCNEIGEARDRGLAIDAVRLLEMAHELYRAEIEARDLDVCAFEETSGAAEGRAALRRIAQGLGELPGKKWMYPGHETDDWGYVRVEGAAGEPGSVVALARSGRPDTRDELNIHRSNGSDPYAPVARHLVNCQPEAIKSLIRLVKALDDDILHLRRLDQEHARLESWIVLHTDFDRYDTSFGTVERLIRSLERMRAGRSHRK